MTTNNHPAHGPLSLDRLHQISEILSKAAAQSDGGNLGYAMADAVKVIDEAISAFGAEPVAEIREDLGRLFVKINQPSILKVGDRLYTVPPAPVVPDALPENDSEDGNDIDYLEPSQVYELGRVTGWNACRAAMLQAGNSPVIPDGWVACSERMPEEGSKVIVFRPRASESNDPPVKTATYKGGREYYHGFDCYCEPTHWMPLPVAPQEVKGDS
ncbi:DUF551 domain-containing protein [Citrobacter freundii]|uniref:DUF551 domain-containing protein n=1 Tax=Citrobacter freundii TaxID=546 RepID=UPI003988BD47